MATTEDAPLSFTIPLTADRASAVTLTVVTPPVHGNVAGQGPTWTYTPSLNFNGDDSLVVRAEDVHGSSMATVTIHVASVDDAPIAGADSFAAVFGNPLTIAPSTLLANDSDIDSPSLTVSAVASGTHGTAVMSGGSVVFTPELGYTGAATFTYTLSDGTVAVIATVTVMIGIDTAPVGVNDVASTGEDTPLVIPDATLLGNDTDAENNTLAISAVTGATHGTVSHSGNHVTYTPAANYHGPATFTYTVTDGYMTDTADVALTVVSVNDAPVAVDDTASTEEDGQLFLVPATTILTNDTDADGDVLAVQSVAATANTHGTVALVTPVSGTLVQYIPDANFNGTADFTYTVTDGNGGTATATVTVTVSAIDDTPVAVADAATMAEDAAATAIDVLANDTDADAGTKTILSVTQPLHGAVVITGSGTGLTYQPGLNYCNLAAPPPLAGIARMLGAAGIFAPAGPDTFTYTLSPGGSTATVSVTVTCVDDPPVAVNDSESVTEDSIGNQFNVTINDTDVDGGPRTIASVTQPSHGAVTVTPSGLFAVYTPAAAYCNEAPNQPPDSFTYTLTPGTSSATVEVTVTCTCGQNTPTDFVVVGSNN